MHRLNNSFLLWGSLCFLALLGLLPAAPSFFPFPQPASAQDRNGETLHGWLRWSERGIGATYDGFAHGLLGGSAGIPLATYRVASALERLLSHPSLAERIDPSMAGVSDFLKGDDPIDLSRLPIVASYDTDVFFELESSGDGAFRLRRGHLLYRNLNQTSFGTGMARFEDSFRGSGRYELDPRRDRIELSATQVDGRLSYHFEVEIRHPLVTDGESVISILDAVEMRGVRRGDVMVMSAPPFLPPVTLWERSPEKLITYLRRIPPAGERAGPRGFTIADAETWTNPFDAQTVVEFGINLEPCEPRIVFDSPRMVFEGTQPAKLEGTARLEGIPEEWADDVEWILPEIGFPPDRVEPEDRRGRRIEFLYEGHPKSNDDFGEQDFRVAFHNLELRQFCGEEPTETALIFFERDTENDHQPKWPNWFYYWRQTRARSNVENVEYSPPSECQELDDPRYTTRGYYYGTESVFLCDPASESNTHLLTVARTRYIDTFAATLLHEDAHRRHYRDWWEPRGVPYLEHTETSYWDDRTGTGRFDYPEDCFDCDWDFVPDALEPGFGLDPDRTRSCRDRLGRKIPYLTDEHCLAYRAESRWEIGAAREEDWARPGSQWPEGGE